MSNVTYTVVEHDGGWAYKVGDVFSETFRTHEAAHAAAERARRSNVRLGEAGRSSTRTVPAAGMRKRNAATIGRTPTSRTDASSLKGSIIRGANAGFRFGRRSLGQS
jgi:hypothetical protein